MKSQLKLELDYVECEPGMPKQYGRQGPLIPYFFRPLLEIALETHSDLGSRASWIVEFAFKKKPEILYPHLDFFTGGIGNLKMESSIRPMAKICELLTLTHYKRKNNEKGLLSLLHGSK